MLHALLPSAIVLLCGIIFSFTLKESPLRSIVRAGTITLAAIPLGLWLLLWLMFRNTSSRDEVSRLTSPDGQTDAVIIEENGGATTSFNYVVEVGPKSSHHMQPAVSIYGATRNAGAYGVNLRWIDNRNL